MADDDLFGQITRSYDPTPPPRGMFGDALDWLWGDPNRGFRRYLSTSAEALGAAPAGIAQGASDIGTMMHGLAQRQGMAEAGLPPAPESELAAVAPGAHALGGLTDFLTGGYATGLVPHAGPGALFREAVAPALADESGALRVGLTPRAFREQEMRLGEPLPAAPDLAAGEYPTAPGHNLGPRMEPEPFGSLEAAPREAQVAPPIPRSREPTFGEQLRAEHLASGMGPPIGGGPPIEPLPLTGAAMKVVPPPHVTDEEGMDRAVGRYVDYAMQGRYGKDWYEKSGQSILAHAGAPEVATPFAGALARTSPQTDVASNLTHAVTLHNQYMAGDPLHAGRFPNDMGADVAKIYYGGERVTGEKIGPFMGATARQWAPGMFPHSFVNDIWNMRGLDYPGPGGAPYTGSPTLGQHNFARIVADRARQRLEQMTGETWTPEQTQAAGWSGIRGRMENMTPQQAAFNFNDALRRNYAQLSWESTPGESTGHFPELFTAPWAQRQAYHDAIQGALTGPDGRDIIASHLGLLTGQTFQAPGYFKGVVSPGSQTPVAVGTAPGGALEGLDPASRELVQTAERVRAILLRQDAAAANKPLWAGNVPVNQRDLFDVSLGRSLTPQETVDIAKAMHQETGTDFHSPIGTTNGFRFINVPEHSKVSNADFVKAANKVMQRSDILPGVKTEAVQTASDGFYEPNDWKVDVNGDTYRQGLGATRSPDLQRRAAELLATLGPRVGAVDDQFAKTHGWTHGPQKRYWEDPAYEAFRLNEIPRTPRPGEVRLSNEVGPGWRKLFGPGSVLGGIAGGLLTGPQSTNQNSPSSGLLSF